jgi:hypothetical protein
MSSSHLAGTSSFVSRRHMPRLLRYMPLALACCLMLRCRRHGNFVYASWWGGWAKVNPSPYMLTPSHDTMGALPCI